MWLLTVLLAQTPAGHPGKDDSPVEWVLFGVALVFVLSVIAFRAVRSRRT